MAFPTTHWSLVLSAAQTASAEAEDALSSLCRTYWQPLYGYVRRQGHAPHDAEDLTQAFFARLLEKGYLSLADRRRGRFRTFLLSALKHFLINQWEKEHAKRRGGGQETVAWDTLGAEERFLAEPSDGLTPEMAYEKRWAATLLEQVLRRLREEAAASERLALFERLKDYLWGETAEGYGAIAVALGQSEVAVKGAAHRLRQRFREVLRAEIAHTVLHDEEIEDELRHLIQVISL
jgi:RNA polymerase sigma-70 factor (ECF subfamily)